MVNGASAYVVVWQVTLFLLPMQLVIKTYGAFFWTLPLFLIGCAGMYFFWWKPLPPKDSEAPIEPLLEANSLEEQENAPAL